MPFTRSRLFQLPLLLLVCAGMAAPPLVNHFRGLDSYPWPAFPAPPDTHDPPPASPGNKDYPLWYHYGRMVVEDPHLRTADGRPWNLYPTDPDRPFPFMYPPFAAVCLGAVSLLGPTGMIVALVVMNAVSFGVVVELSVRMVAGTGDVSIWLRTIPAAICLFFINDLFLLGQPNMGLLGLILGGLMLTRSGKAGGAVAAGGLFALAAALKAFPVVVLIYLVWRRRWVAAASMVGFGVLFTLFVPAAVRGWDRTVLELKTWADGMLLRQGEEGHGQRPEESVGWRNQSLFGVANRLLRPGNARAEEGVAEQGKLNREVREGRMTQDQAAAVAADPNWAGRSLFVNVVDLDFRGAGVGALVIAGVLGLGFVLVMPNQVRRTRTTDAAEFGMLVTLMTVATPYAWGYYFAWLVYPLTVLVHHGLSGEKRWPAWAAVGAVAGLFALNIPAAPGVGGWVVPMAYGTLFWAAMAALVGCGWVIREGRTARRPPIAPPAFLVDHPMPDPLPLVAYQIHDVPSRMTLSAAPIEREWMEAAHLRFPYRCLPLNIANQNGWVIACPTAFRAYWYGGPAPADVEVRFDGPPDPCIMSHFGVGTITFSLPYLFRTPPGVNLWAKGAANWIKDGIQALEGIIETDWASSTFTMNWKLTRPNEWVRFEVGEPICMIVPIPRGYAEGFAPRVEMLKANPELHEKYKAWEASRSGFLKGLQTNDPEAVKQGWQKDYFQGKTGEGTFEGHQTRLHIKEFEAGG